MTKSLAQIGEFGLIKSLAKQLSSSSKVICGIGDDTAVLPFSSKAYQLITTDMLVEDVHFTRRMKATGVGYKALACNVSDIAAMGGMPKYAVVSIGVPSRLSTSYVKDLYAGLQTCAKEF